LIGEKGQDRIAPAGCSRLGGPNPHPSPDKPKPTATTVPEPAPGPPQEKNLQEIGSTFKPDELEL